MFYVFEHFDSADGASVSLRPIKRAKSLEEAKSIWEYELWEELNDYYEDQWQDAKNQFIGYKIYKEVTFLEVKEVEELDIKEFILKANLIIDKKILEQDEKRERMEYEKLKSKFKGE